MKTKVLLIGPAYFAYNQSIASAFDPDRFEIKIIEYTEKLGQINLLNKIVYFFSTKRINTTVKLLTKLNQYILNTYNRYRPDVILIIKGDTINDETILKMKGSKRILWMLDGIFYHPQSVKLAFEMDAVFLFEKTDITEARKINSNTFYLPPAFDDQIFRKLPLKKDIDILFIGVLYDSRIKLLEKLQKRFPQLNIKVYCKRYWFYKTPLKYFKSLTDSMFINRFVTPIQANILYNRSKICLNMHHAQSIYGINPRFFEILGARALQFVDHKLYIDEFFSEYDVQTYNNEEELFEMISQQFANNSEQENNKLYDTICKYHTYKKRVEYILGKI